MKSFKCSMLAGLLLLFACSSQKGLNSNHYHYQLKKGRASNMAVIQGSLFDGETNSPLSINGAVKIGDSIMAKTDASGIFKFYVKPESYRITGTGYPYRLLTTKKIRLSAGDTLKLEMFIKFESSTVN